MRGLGRTGNHWGFLRGSLVVTEESLGVIGRCSGLVYLRISRNVPHMSLMSSQLSLCCHGSPCAPLMCVTTSLRCPQRCSCVPYWCTCIPGDVPRGVPCVSGCPWGVPYGCLSSLSLSSWVSPKMSLSPCIPPWVFPVVTCASCVTPGCLHILPMGCFPWMSPQLSLCPLLMSPRMSLHLHIVCLCALAVPIGVPVSPPPCTCVPLMSGCLPTVVPVSLHNVRDPLWLPLGIPMSPVFQDDAGDPGTVASSAGTGAAGGGSVPFSVPCHVSPRVPL